VRITAPTVEGTGKFAQHQGWLIEQGYEVPIVADIHFQAGGADGGCAVCR